MAIMFKHWNYFFLINIFWISSVLSQKANDTINTTDPVDFTVVDDCTLKQTKKSTDGLPVDVNLNLDVLGRTVSLKLKRNPKATNAKNIYVIRKSESGIPVVLPYGLGENEVFGEYQDPNNCAIFTLSCPKDSKNSTTGACDTTMEGTFCAGNQEYRMSPMADNALGRVKRHAGHSSQLWNKAKTIATAAKAASKVYGIYKTEQLPGTPTDYKVEDPIELGRVAAFGKTAKVVRESVLPGTKKYNLEILAVIDYGVYRRFYKASKQGTEAAKDNEAKFNLKKYFSHVFNGVDMLYQTIDDPEFSLSVAVSGFIIADKPDVSPWTTPHIDRNPEGRHDLLVSVPLDELLRWSFSARNLPENDHIMLLTDYDLYSMDSGSIDKRTAGYARVGSVCSMDSVSVIEDHGGFQSINAAAHELGHGLGSRHDGKMNSCNPKDQYIMTAHGGFETETTKGNPWRFSPCSIAYFKDYISRLRPHHCLSDPVDIFDRDEYIKFISTHPGQDYTPNEQCQDILGLDSFYGWGPELGKFSDICTEMSCKVPGASRSYRVYKAATGTSCGDKKWCMEGRCVFGEKAPPKDPSCVFGDIQRRFGRNKQSCRQYMLENPMRCYDKFYSTRCCDTCDRLNTGVRGCEFGDKFLNCRASSCFDKKYARDCCSTCGIAPHPVIKSIATTTTLRPPATRKPWTPKPTTRKPWTRRPTTRKPWTPQPRPTTRKPWTQRPTPAKTWTHVPIPTRRPARRTTTTAATVKPSGSSGLCISPNSRFLLVFKCSSLPGVFGQNACDNTLVSRYCCERCPEPKQQGCVDSPNCKVKNARECYTETNQKECCKTCRRFETGRRGCEFGDKIRSCERYVGELGISLVCSRYKDYCCGICNALATNREPTNINDIHKPIDPLSGAVKMINRVDPTLRTITVNGKISENKGKGIDKTNKDTTIINLGNTANKDSGRPTNDKNKDSNLTPLGKNDSPRTGISNGFTFRAHAFQNRPGHIVHTIVYRPINRGGMGNIHQRRRPVQRERLIRRLNFLVNQG
ncbi:uncharacterized protein LOC128550301 [Mercenaria mercenaria]|uniref:uncharacterized protein LOC128550301 n=1 Tax=Mercenaria mercenaria TaxID=6596 RepID=UPI00234E884D|nr:uncharacterized protein LOC128550301 [Mercenaria mercenaria]